jgi:hypothetical protein
MHSDRRRAWRRELQLRVSRRLVRRRTASGSLLHHCGFVIHAPALGSDALGKDRHAPQNSSADQPGPHVRDRRHHHAHPGSGRCPLAPTTGPRRQLTRILVRTLAADVESRPSTTGCMPRASSSFETTSRRCVCGHRSSPPAAQRRSSTREPSAQWRPDLSRTGGRRHAQPRHARSRAGGLARRRRPGQGNVASRAALEIVGEHEAHGRAGQPHTLIGSVAKRRGGDGTSARRRPRVDGRRRRRGADGGRSSVSCAASIVRLGQSLEGAVREAPPGGDGGRRGHRGRGPRTGAWAAQRELG